MSALPALGKAGQVLDGPLPGVCYIHGGFHLLQRVAVGPECGDGQQLLQCGVGAQGNLGRGHELGHPRGIVVTASASCAGMVGIGGNGNGIGEVLPQHITCSQLKASHVIDLGAEPLVVDKGVVVAVELGIGRPVLHLVDVRQGHVKCIGMQVDRQGVNAALDDGSRDGRWLVVVHVALGDVHVACHRQLVDTQGEVVFYRRHVGTEHALVCLVVLDAHLGQELAL